MSKRAAAQPRAQPQAAAPPPPPPVEPLPKLALAVAPLLFGSGFCALVYQIAWQREFRLVFGASTAASAAVIAVFMGGLGLGGLQLGPRVDRHVNPLRLYAALEMMVALTAAATPALLGLVRSAYLGLGGTVVLGAWGGTAVRLALAALVLLPPTFLAGGTLGAAARALEREGDRRRRATALLYGVNTAGALAGCLAATFWLLERFGTQTTLWLAATANALVALVAATVARAGQAAEPVRVEPQPTGAAAAPPRFVLAAAAGVGFAFFLLELVWYRMLAPILGGTVYTFGLVLAVALLGIAAGGVLYGTALSRSAVSLQAFAASCLLEAAGVALAYALGDRIALLALALRPPPGSLLSAYIGGWLCVTGIVVLPASLVAGAQFPLLVALLGGGRERVGRHLGGAYFWNTAGGIAGALAGGFGLLPILTAPGCWRAVALMLAGLGLLAAWADRGRTPRRFATAGAFALAVAMLLSGDGPSAAWRHSSIGVGRATAPSAATPNAQRAWIHEQRRSIAWEREGVESSVAAQTLAGLSFVLNGKVDGNARNDAPTQVMSGLLGALLHERARRSMVIGLGTGSTAGWLAAVPAMERVDVVELEPAILEFARFCGPVNQQAMDNPKLHVVTGDAREVLMAGRERYDLVFSEPSNPYRAGVASLFTREFYAAVASRLEPDGLFLQWVQAYDVDERTVSTVIATLASVLPEVEVWQVHQVDLVLIASRQPQRLSAAALRARLREEPFAGGLRAAWRGTELEDVLARFVAGPALARRLRATAPPPNTDDRNSVEFSFARTLSRSGLFDVLKLRRDAAALGAHRPEITGGIDWGRVARQRLAIYTIAGSAPPVPADADESERARAAAHAQYLAGDLAGAVRTFGLQPQPPEGAVEATLFAEGLAEAGDQAAIGRIQELRAVAPVEAEAATARLALRLGQTELAKGALLSALLHYRGDPWPSQVGMTHALSLVAELAAARPDMTPALFEVLSEPFAVAALEEPRRLVRLGLATRLGLDDRCRQALHPLEPYVPWREDLLRYRASCYQRARDERAPQAQAQLQEFLRRER